jgi:hypothetical protein
MRSEAVIELKLVMSLYKKFIEARTFTLQWLVSGPDPD